MSRYRTADGVPGLSLPEWKSGRLADVRLSDRDLRLAERLRKRGRSAGVEVRPDGSGVAVETRGSVGLVRFDGFELRIEPKLPGDHLQLFRMVEYAEGLSGLAQLAGSPRLGFGDHDLLDLVVAMLSELSERLVRAGLRADYVEREGALPALRGRFLPDRQVLDRLGLLDQVVCRYDEHEHDIADNQLLALALRRGARVPAATPIRRRARTLAATFEDLCDPAAFPLHRGRDACAYDRTNEHYRDAHELAWLLLEGLGPESSMSAGEKPVRSFLIDMSRLFERFVEKVLSTNVPAGHRVRAQRSHSIFWDADRRRPYGSIRPDFLIESEGPGPRRFPVDAKYKRYSGPEGEKISAADLSQAFLYAYAYRDPDLLATPLAGIVFPSERPGAGDLLQLEVHTSGERLVQAKVIAVGLHIPTVLDRAGSTFPAT